MEIYEKSYKRIAKARRLGGDFIENANFTHTCCKSTCHPQNETVLIKRGILTGPPLSADVYVCRYNQKHICVETLCKSCKMGICTISGACHGQQGGYSSYDRNDKKTWHTNTLPAPKKVKNVKIVATDIIEKLLFSTLRKNINAKRDNARLKIHTRDVQAYIKQCKDEYQPYNLINIMIMKVNYMGRPCKLEILDYDEDYINKYTDIVLHVHKIIEKYHTDVLKSDMLTLGTLYIMRQGFIVNNVSLLPADVFLLYNLPEINDLPSFGYGKRKIASGMQTIEFVLKRAIEQGAYVKEIAYQQKNNGEYY